MSASAVSASSRERASVDRTTLRAAQEPLKQRYRDDPDAALVVLRASATLGEGITCSVETGRALAEAGLHPATGGDGASLCSGDMLLEALAACAGVTLLAVVDLARDPDRGRPRPRRRRPRLPRHARRRPRGARRLSRDPAPLRPRHPGDRGAARDAAPSHGALLRRLPEPRGVARALGVARQRISRLELRACPRATARTANVSSTGSGAVRSTPAVRRTSSGYSEPPADRKSR